MSDLSAEKVVADLRDAPSRPMQPSDYFSLVRRAADLIAHQAARLEEVTRERDRARGLIREKLELIEVHLAALTAAEAEKERYQGLLEPFAKAAEDCGVEDDLRIGIVKPADVIWESAAAASITFGHLESARAALSEKETGDAVEA